MSDTTLTPERLAELRTKIDAAPKVELQYGVDLFETQRGVEICINDKNIDILFTAETECYPSKTGQEAWAKAKETDEWKVAALLAWLYNLAPALLAAAEEAATLRAEVERVTDIAAMKAEVWDQNITTLRAECESHRNARRTLADDLVALGAGKPTVLELSRGADRRIAKLEAERDAALAELERCRRALVGDYVSAVVGVTSQEGAQMSMDAALAVLDEYGKENEGLNQRITILEAENTKLRRWLDDAEAELERLREAVAIEGETP